MALTRKFLKALGIEDEKVDEIISAHTETVDALKAERDGYKADAEKLPGVQSQLDDANAALNDTKDGGFKAKYEAEHQAFEEYKADIAAKETHAAKESAVKAYFREKGIADKSMTLAMRYIGADVDALELADGKIKDTKSLDDAIAGDLSSLVVTTGTKGADTATPTRQLPRIPLRPLTKRPTRSNTTRNESVTCNGWRSFFMPKQHKQPAAWNTYTVRWGGLVRASSF